MTICTDCGQAFNLERLHYCPELLARDTGVTDQIMGVLDERGQTHGDYTHMSITIQKIKDAMRAGEGWQRCNAGQREALELMATKIGRIVCGDPNHNDHWADIIGYTTKALERIGVPK